ncbi:MAG TPA: hypothetical protein VN937_01560 [Blastocatellia bacterium]|nr:hypothetical protein [Blastocatellia bacterium]
MAIDRPRTSGFVLHKIDVPAALAVLDRFLEEDESEQRETFEHLKHALNETRAAQGERPLFPEIDESPSPVSANPWLEVHGSLRDDPTYDDFMTEISRNRQENNTGESDQ